MSSERLPEASLVISSRERPSLLRDAVESVLACADIPAEIVVVDQSDSSPPEALLALADSRCAIRYQRFAGRGLAGGRNTGAAVAAHDVLVFMDDDMVATETWFRALLEALAGAGDRAVVTGRVSAGEPEVARAARPATVAGDDQVVYEGRLRTDVLAGGNMAIPRSALLEVGGWDGRLGPGSRFPAAEDNDLGFRLLERGYRIVYVPDAELVHRAWRSRAGGLALRWSYGRGKGGFYAKHARTARRHMVRRFGVDVAKRVRRFPRRLAAQPGLAAEDLVYSLGVVSGAAHWLAVDGDAAVVRRGSRLRRVVALTFDDGPSEWTDAILDVLGRHGARATFFVVGSAIAGRETTVRRTVEAGHELGNHLFAHRGARDLDDGELALELVRTRATILDATGADARLVRPPYGSQAARVAHAARQVGLGPTVLWSVDPEDWRDDDGAAIATRVVEAAHRGAIVDLHDGIPPESSGRPTREATIRAVERLVPELLRRGYRCVTVSELLR